jgi:hypothetical protein
MALNFPANPTLDQIYTVGNSSWKWDGTSWNAYTVTVSAPVSPTFTYTNGALTSIAYGSGESKIFTYTNSLLTQLDFIKGSTTVRKTFNYTDGVLTSITQVTL